MSDQLPPGQEDQTPASEAENVTPVRSSGSLIAGMAIAWAIVIGGSLLGFSLVSSFGAAVFLVPIGICFILAFALMFRDQTRTGGGILLGLLSLAAVVLLLVAACFGMLRGTSFD